MHKLVANQYYLSPSIVDITHLQKKSRARFLRDFEVILSVDNNFLSEMDAIKVRLLLDIQF